MKRTPAQQGAADQHVGEDEGAADLRPHLAQQRAGRVGEEHQEARERPSDQQGDPSGHRHRHFDHHLVHQGLDDEEAEHRHPDVDRLVDADVGGAVVELRLGGEEDLAGRRQLGVEIELAPAVGAAADRFRRDGGKPFGEDALVVQFGATTALLRYGHLVPPALAMLKIV